MHSVQSMPFMSLKAQASGVQKPIPPCRNYMKYKNMKLREQFQVEAVEGDAAGKPKLFAGISIHVNGFTSPTHQARKNLYTAAKAESHCADSVH